MSAATEEMTYSESAKGVRITQDCAIQELRNHGATHEDIEEFLTTATWRNIGGKTTYDAGDVLSFLGY